MDDPKAARDKLRSIKQLWRELERTEESTPAYEILIEKIRGLSAEYKALIDAPGKRGRSAKSVPNGTDSADR